MNRKIVGWNMQKNTPWLGVKRGFPFKRDHWLAGKMEHQWLVESLDKLFQGAGELVRNILVLLHKAYSPDGGFGVEVYGHAVKLGLMAYEDDRWRLIPDGSFN